MDVGIKNMVNEQRRFFVEEDDGGGGGEMTGRVR